MIQRQEVVFSHCCGDVQPADMLTKPLSSSRLRALSSLIGLIDEAEIDVGASSNQSNGSSIAAAPNPGNVIPKVLVALLLLSQATTGDAVRDDQVVIHGSGVSVDYGLVTWMCIGLMVLGCLVFWEGLKWFAWVVYDRAIPGAKSRRLRRLQRLRDATTDAIQREIEHRRGSRLEQRAIDSATIPPMQRQDPPRVPVEREHSGQTTQIACQASSGSGDQSDERLQLLRRLAKGMKEMVDQGVQTSAFSPVQGPGTRVILRYVHEPPGEAFIVPDNECYHVYDDCYAFRHRGTRGRVQRRRLCQYCFNRASEDPDKTPNYGRDLASAREYEELFNTTLTTSGQSSGMSRS